MPSRTAEADKRNWKRLIALLGRINDGFVVITLVFLLANNFFHLAFGWNLINTSTALLNIAPILILSIVFLFLRLGIEIRDRTSDLESLLHLRAKVLEEGEKYPTREMILNCRKINILTLYGTVTFPLNDDDVVESIKSNRRKSEITILIANPFSESIRRRYRDDEPDTHKSGIAGIQQALIWLNKIAQQLPADARKRLHIHVYDNYPTISVFQGDHRIYFSYYGYNLRGDDTPTVLTDSDARLGSAVLKHFKDVLNDAPSIGHWLQRHYDQLTDKESVVFSSRYAGVFLRTNSGTFLFQRRDKKPKIENPGRLTVFGGRALNSETPLENARRELREELTLAVNPSELRSIRTLVTCKNSHDCVLESYFLLEGVDKRKLVQMEGADIEELSREEALSRADLTEIPRKILEEISF